MLQQSRIRIIRRIGDDQSSPQRLAVLQSDLRAAFGSKYATSNLAVTKYGIFVNWSHGSQEAGRALFGRSLLAVALPSDCTKEKVPDGWYAPDEAPGVTAPVVVEIEASLDGKPVSARLVYVSPAELIGMFRDRDKANAALLEAIHQADVKLIDAIKALPR